MDERDGNNYTVVKIGGRWVMAQNLNYQKGLTWQAQANQPSTYSGQDLALIGHFWCPGTNYEMTAARVACAVFGALYSWETAMSLDGRGTWAEVAVYAAAAANAEEAKFNHGRTAHSGTGTGGRGICPPNWHVPTEFEWGVLLDAMEGGGTAHQNATGSVEWYGLNAGKYAKSACTGTSTDTDAKWFNPNNTDVGTDAYGFRVLPAGIREADGSWFNGRSLQSAFWNSSAASGSKAWSRSFYFNRATVYRVNAARSFGLPVRCIRD
jgi:uncharacterized protein (TIGR02145 family)